MAGVYVHIPFCKTKCIYCDFYSITNWTESLKERFLQAVIKEMILRKDFLTKPIETIYFGGGTPSLLNPVQIQKLIDAIKSNFVTEKELEITVELNPEDVNNLYASYLKEKTEINRISLGVQSFDEKDLKFLKRRHNKNQSHNAIRLLHNAGFTNISIDLIYGLPWHTVENLKSNLREFVKYNLPHLSAYHLTVEPNTPLHKLVKSGKVRMIDEETSIKLYDFLIDFMNEYGYLHYEISNFAKNGFISKHNFAYWTGKQYLGLGPAAHSYNGKMRVWNKPSLTEYLTAIESGKLAANYEILTEKDKFNEYILTHLRTYLGISIDYLIKKFGKYFEMVSGSLDYHLNQGNLEKSGQNVRLTRKGKHIADSIIADLFV